MKCNLSLGTRMTKTKRKDLDWRERLFIAVIGLFAMIYGYGQILRGHLIYENYRGLDVPAQLPIFLGAIFLLVAVFPWGRIHILWEDGRKKHHR